MAPHDMHSPIQRLLCLLPLPPPPSLPLAVPFWPVLVSIMLYSLLTPWLLYTFPESFTLGEAMLVAQGGTLLLVDMSMQLLSVVSKREL